MFCINALKPGRLLLSFMKKKVNKEIRKECQCLRRVCRQLHFLKKVKSKTLNNVTLIVKVTNSKTSLHVL